jgi:two-component system, NarL family, sensor kinase
MKKVLFSFFLLIFFNVLLAQSGKVGSLKKACERVGLSNFDEVIRLSEEGKKESLKQNDSVSYAVFGRIAGLAFYFKGDYNNAAISYFNAIKIFERFSDKKELALSYNELAKLYRKTKKLELSEANYDKAMKIYEQLGDSINISTIYNESGVVFEYKQDYKEALRRYTMSKNISERLGNKVGSSYALNNIAGVFSLQNRFNEADKYLKEALKIRRELRDTFATAINLSDIGMNDFYGGNFERAIIYFDSSNTIALKLRYPELRSHNLSFISLVYEKLGKADLAYTFYKEHIKLKDSIFTMESEKQLAELNTKYQSEKKDREIESQRKQNFIKNIIILAILLLMIASAAAGYLFFRKRQLEQKAKLDKEIALQRELRTKAVVEAEEKERRRIAQDLHDSVGQILSAAKLNLSAFSSMVKLKEQIEIDTLKNVLDLIDDSVKEVRTVSHSMMPNVLIKLGLASAVREFILKIGNLPNLKVDLEIIGMGKRLDEQTESVLYRVIQEIVNNIIKHSRANRIVLQLIKDDSELTVLIEDNGIGFDTSRINESKGIGLRNIISRIEFLNGTVHFDSTPGHGTNVVIEVPMA